MIRMVDYSHHLLDSDEKVKIALDLTCGNGRDTLFLAKIAKKVYAFDIQDSAIANTNSLLAENNVTNTTIIQASHDCFDEYVIEPVDLAIFNLGYLPGCERSIKTEGRIVVESLKKLLPKLRAGGKVVLVIYSHDPEEGKTIEAYCSTLSGNFDVLRHNVINRKDSPYLIEIRKS